MSKSRVFHTAFSPPAPACRSTNRLSETLEPRSTCHHLLDDTEHHLSVLPALTEPFTAFAGPSLALHDESAVAGRFSARLPEGGGPPVNAKLSTSNNPPMPVPTNTR